MMTTQPRLPGPNGYLIQEACFQASKPGSLDSCAIHSVICVFAGFTAAADAEAADAEAAAAEGAVCFTVSADRSAAAVLPSDEPLSKTLAAIGVEPPSTSAVNNMNNRNRGHLHHRDKLTTLS